MDETVARGAARFGSFELDLHTGDLKRRGERVVLVGQPLQILRMLVAGDGRTVLREDIRKKLWPNNTIVEFDHSINSAIKKLRHILGDSAESSRYIETIPGRGYRLMLPVEWVGADTSSGGTPPITVRTQLQSALIGKKVAHYRVLEVLGGGGMGMVYRAEDLKLGRRVALKFLPEELAWDPVALQRFEREARTASSLDHANICTVYEVEEYEEQPFIVMQLLEGETLRDRLSALVSMKKTMPIEELLDIGIQIASGLEAAHAKGIIHRDIKPANIFLTSSGQVKILDFGLAKAVSTANEPSSDGVQLRPTSGFVPGHDCSRAAAAAAATPRALQPPTADGTMTRLGIAIGTAGYMSPEQIRGEKLDARTDIFSFGLVLYEMATGRRAFSGETAEAVHDAILNKPPDSANDLKRNLPTKVIIIIDTALEKERDRRHQTVADMRVGLGNVQEAMAPVARSSRLVKRVALTGVVALFVVTMAVGIWWWRRPLTQRAFQRYQIAALTSLGNVQFADISPDGRYLAYTDEDTNKQSLWVQELSTRNTVRVVGPTSHLLGGVRFTPDSRALYYIQEKDGSGIYRVPLMGGSSENVARNVEYFSSVDVSSDGQHILFSRTLDADKMLLLTTKLDGSEEKRVFAGENLIGTPVWAPDGQTIAFATDHAGTGLFDGVTVLSKDGKARELLHHALLISGLAWLPDQSGLIVGGRALDRDNLALWVVSYPAGRLRRISNDLADYRGVSLTRMGNHLVTVQKQMDCWLWVAPASDPSQATPLRDGAGKKDGIRGVVWLPDGRLVYGDGDVISELWLVDRDGGHRRQLTHTDNRASFPASNPTGSEIAFAREDTRTNVWDIWMTDTFGSNMRKVTSGGISKWKPEISPDGRWMTYFTREGTWKMPLGGGDPVKVEQGGDYAAMSPDGRWIAIPIWDANERATKLKIVASDRKAPARFLPFTDEHQVPISTDILWPAIRWTADGKFITYVRTQNGVSNIWAQPVDGGAARRLTNFTSMIIWSHDWSRDGKYVVMARGNFSRDAVMLTDVR